MKGRDIFKETVLTKSLERNDEWGNKVQVRVNGATSDLGAAEARYHDLCRVKCMHVSPGQNETEEFPDEGLEIIINILSEDRGKVWTVIEVYNVYKENNGTENHLYNMS